MNELGKCACYHRAVMPSGRTARHCLPACALTLPLLASAQTASPAFSYDDLLSELAVVVAGALRQDDHVQLVAADDALARDLERRLTERGVRVLGAPQADASVITVACSNTISDRFCAAEIQRGPTRELLSVHRAAGVPLPAAPLVLDLQPLVTERVPILDVSMAGQHLLVLHPSALARYARGPDGWRVQDARAIPSRRAWPRDVRGRLAVDGTRLEVFLPGTWCRGTVHPFDLTCGEEQRPWPIGFENTGMAADRNDFGSPDGLRYFAVVPLDGEPGARWLAATADGNLVLLDDARKPLDGVAGSADDIGRLSSPCATGDLVLLPVASSLQEESEGLRLFRVSGRRLRPLTPPVALPGTLTALWTRTDANSATAVCHNPNTGLYEAFQVGVSCGR